MLDIKICNEDIKSNAYPINLSKNVEVAKMSTLDIIAGIKSWASYSAKTLKTRVLKLRFTDP